MVSFDSGDSLVLIATTSVSAVFVDLSLAREPGTKWIAKAPVREQAELVLFQPYVGQKHSGSSPAAKSRAHLRSTYLLKVMLTRVSLPNTGLVNFPVDIQYHL